MAASFAVLFGESRAAIRGIVALESSIWIGAFATSL
jgi:hypothetical protein